jgi:hypothetical protein
MSVAPATYLVAKDPKPACPSGPHRTFGDNAALLAAGVTDRRLLDYEPGRRETDFERRVVQVARRSPLLGATGREQSQRGHERNRSHPKSTRV